MWLIFFAFSFPFSHRCYTPMNDSWMTVRCSSYDNNKMRLWVGEEKEAQRKFNFRQWLDVFFMLTCRAQFLHSPWWWCACWWCEREAKEHKNVIKYSKHFSWKNITFMHKLCMRGWCRHSSFLFVIAPFVPLFFCSFWHPILYSSKS